MSIEELSSSVKRLLGSSQKLADPTAVVKELIDNSLDAAATNITIELTPNVVDHIIVKDNGCGIPSQDRTQACRRYYTSKIRSYTDLRALGGQSLGFRGEGLANVAEMCASLSLITRAEGEEAAECLKILQDGAVCGRSKASHPVGTTIKVTDLFKFMPVRSQQIKASAAKQLAKMKRIIYAYALARQCVRLSIKVINMKSTVYSFTFVPSSPANPICGIRQIIGNDCANECRMEVFKKHGFTLQAALPKEDAQTEKICGKGQFLSVDSRPMTAINGNLKQVLRLFHRKFLNRHPSAKEPFVWLNVDCPSGSYDVNVESLKDDVIFDDASTVISVIEDFFSTCYPGSRGNAVESENIPTNFEPGFSSNFNPDSLAEFHRNRVAECGSTTSNSAPACEEYTTGRPLDNERLRHSSISTCNNLGNLPVEIMAPRESHIHTCTYKGMQASSRRSPCHKNASSQKPRRSSFIENTQAEQLPALPPTNVSPSSYPDSFERNTSHEIRQSIEREALASYIDFGGYCSILPQQIHNENDNNQISSVEPQSLHFDETMVPRLSTSPSSCDRFEASTILTRCKRYERLPNISMVRNTESPKDDQGALPKASEQLAVADLGMNQMNQNHAHLNHAACEQPLTRDIRRYMIQMAKYHPSNNAPTSSNVPQQINNTFRKGEPHLSFVGSQDGKSAQEGWRTPCTLKSVGLLGTSKLNRHRLWPKTLDVIDYPAYPVHSQKFGNPAQLALKESKRLRVELEKVFERWIASAV